ncbi:MAG: aminotransferase class V-fold PLP-dependent enzyme, partial [Bacteroidia bacterium]
MSHKSNSKNNNSRPDTRRQFIKYKVLGGLLGIIGLPFLSFGRDINPTSKGKLFQSKKLSKDANWDEIRRQFSLRDNFAHLNTSSQGPSPTVVVNNIIDTLKNEETRATYNHAIVKQTREKISSLLNTNSDQIAITRNTTEGMNIVARSLALQKGDEVIMSKDEHIGGAAIWIALEKELGIRVVLIDLDYSGKDNLKILKKSLTNKTKVVMLSHITCTTGMILPAKKIVKLCRENRIISVIDGAQAFGAIPIDLGDINPDFYVTSGHKWLFGPKGTGVLFMNRKFLLNNPPHFAGAYSDSKFDLSSKTLDFLDV